MTIEARDGSRHRYTVLNEVAITRGIIEKSGSWFSYKGERLAQGRENCRKAIEDSPEIFAELEQLIRNQGATDDMIEEGFAEDDEELDIRTLGLEDD